MAVKGSTPPHHLLEAKKMYFFDDFDHKKGQNWKKKKEETNFTRWVPLEQSICIGTFPHPVTWFIL